MPMMTPQILKSVHFTKTHQSRYLENKKLFFLQIKEFISYKSRAKNSFFCSRGNTLFHPDCVVSWGYNIISP